MEGASVRIEERSKSQIHTSSSSWDMPLPKFRHRQARLDLLPTICESRAFHEERVYQRTQLNSELIKTRYCTRKGYTKLTQRFDDDDCPEEERPLLSSCTQASSDSKPTRDGRGKVLKKGLRVSWPRSPRRSRLRLRVKVFSPVFLLRTMRNAYVRVLSSLGSKANQRAWISVGARAM